MRKGLTLTLTALAVALFAFPAYALGPKIGGVPDVYLTEKSQTMSGALYLDDDPVLIYRYSDALVLWDYVTPSTGSSSDTMYMSYALLDADLDGTVLSFDWLSDTAVHYGIIAEDGAVVDALNSTPGDLTALRTDADWEAQKTAQINPLLGDPDLSKKLSDAGALTFQNIRINPLPVTGGASSPTQGRAGLPAGVYDIQEANLFVYDGSTTPAEDQILLVTLDSTANVPTDTLTGGGPVYQLESDKSASTPEYDNPSGSAGWLTVRAGYTPDQVGLSLTTGLPTAASNNLTGTLSASFGTTQNATNPFAVAVFQTLGNTAGDEGLDVTADRVYRMTATLASSNATATTNPNARIDINGRQTVGEAFSEITAKTDAGAISLAPTSSSPVDMPACFLWPRGAGHVELLVALWDTEDSQSGTLTVSGMVLESFEYDKLVGANSILSEGGAGTPFDVGTIAQYGTAGSYAFAAAPLDTTAAPTINADSIPTLTGASTAASLGITGTANAASEDGGVGAFLGTDNFSTSADAKLVVVEAQVRTTSGETDRIPPFHLAVQESGKNTRFGFLLDRTIDGANAKTNDDFDFTTTATPVRIVFEAKPSTSYSLEFYSVLVLDALSRTVSGTLIIDSIDVTEYDLPAER